MTARIIMIGGSRNGRTHVPYRPTTGPIQPMEERSTVLSVWAIGFAVAAFLAPIISGVAQ